VDKVQDKKIVSVINLLNRVYVFAQWINISVDQNLISSNLFQSLLDIR